MLQGTFGFSDISLVGKIRAEPMIWGSAQRIEKKFLHILLCCIHFELCAKLLNAWPSEKFRLKATMLLFQVLSIENLTSD